MNIYTLYEFSDSEVIAFSYKRINHSLKMLVYNVKRDDLYIITDKEKNLENLSYEHYKKDEHKRRIIQLFWEVDLNEL